MKKTKRALELEEAEARVSRLRAEVAEEAKHTAAYLKKELCFHLMRLFSQVELVRCEDNVVRVMFRNSFLLRVFVAQKLRNEGKTQLLFGDMPFVTFYKNTCDVSEASNVPGYYVRLLGEVLPDALRIVQDIIPAWHKNPPDVELLMTSRVLRWISKQIGGQWPDIVAGHVVDKIKNEE